MVLTKEQFIQIFKRCPKKKINIYLTELNKVLIEGDLITKERIAMFCAQIAHESGELRWWKEFADGSAYEGRKSLGNTIPGYGKKYKGRSPIQLTGFNNYKTAGEFLGIDLINKPELAETPEVGFRICVWYWTTHNLNKYADAKDVKGCTLVINGGLTNLKEREKYFNLAMKVL